MALSTLLAAAAMTGCGESKAPDDPLDMLPEDTVVVFQYDMEAISDSEAGEVIEEKLDPFWDSSIADMGILMNETESLTAGATEDDIYTILKGRFDFEYIRDDLNDHDYDDDDYRGYEVWSGGRIVDVSTVALIEESGMVMVGSEDRIQGILRSLARGGGARSRGMEATLRAMDRAGEGLVTFGIGECAEELRGCEAVAGSLAEGGPYEFRLVQALLFRNQQTAESQLDDVRDLAEEEETTFSIDSFTTDGEFVIGILSIDEDDFADEATIERGLMSY